MTAFATLENQAIARPSPIAALDAFISHLRVTDSPIDRDEFIDAASLAQPESGPLAQLIDRLVAGGFGINRRAVAASLMLRHGWAAGPIVAAHLALGQAMAIQDFALRFSASTLVEGIWIRRATFSAHSLPGDMWRTVLGALIAFSEDMVEGLHRWSGSSLHSLWAMLTSSWVGQYAAIGQKLGCCDIAVNEARSMLASEPRFSRAVPDIYEVRLGGRSEICQRRKACCLFYKGPHRQYCASCPILPSGERLQRNQEWVCRA